MSHAPARPCNPSGLSPYQIRTFVRDGKASARAYFAGKPTAIVATTKTEQDAVRDVEQQLVARDHARHAERKNGIPCAVEFADAFAVLEISEKQWTMLRAHLHAPGATMTAEAIAGAAGYASYRVANSQYGE